VTEKIMSTVPRHAGGHAASVRRDEAAASDPARSSVAVARGVPPTVWFEIEDLLRHFDIMGHPTGIARFCLEVFAEIDAHYGVDGRARFCRLSFFRRRFEIVDFAFLMAAYRDPTGADAPWSDVSWLLPGSGLAKLPGVLRRLPRFVYRLARQPARDYLRGGRHWRRFEETLAPGDVVVNLGGSWLVGSYAKRILDLKRRRGIKFSQMLHDIGAMAVPEWAAKLTRGFVHWVDTVLPAADLILTVSEHARADIESFGKRTGRTWPPVKSVRLGLGFRDRRAVQKTSSVVRPWPDRFVMFVSTLERRRKNHAFLIGVWQRLVERHGADAIPPLFFIGQVASTVDFLDLRAKLIACDSVGGKISIIIDLSDVELEEAYRRCLFTLYPSLYEGWGSPVAESLGHGKFCIASNRTSLPEVGGDFCDYFDPTDEAEAVAKIERTLFEPGYLAAREAHIRAAYRRPTWADCAHQLMAELTALSSPTAPRRTPAAQ
jgi:glycosyltransferase involved in cell wall biosynthesis